MFERVDMRFLFWLLVISSVLWGGYWFIGSRAVEKTAILALNDAAQAGNSIAYSSLNTTGFPSRFDTTIKDIDILTLSGVRWKAAFFQVFSLSYKPHHVIAVWPHEQWVEYQGTSAKISTADLRASLVVKPKTTLELDRFQMTGEDIQIVANEAETYRSSAISAASRQGSVPFSHDVSVKMSGISMPSPRDPTEIVSIETVEFDANLEFDAHIGRSEVPARPTALILNKLALSQANVNVTFSGALTFDFDGYATGALTLTTQNWEEGFAMIEEVVAIPAEQSNTIKTVLNSLAAASGSATDIHVPLSVKRGRIFMGFIPLGFIPPL